MIVHRMMRIAAWILIASSLALVDELRSAPSVLVHYDPSVPGHSVLRSGAAVEHLIPAGLAILSLAVAWSLFWIIRRTAPHASPQP